MKIEENVNGKNAQTEEIVTDNEKKEGALAVLGKFKDVDALARAYGALEAEFTRRSQRLRDLEKEVENFKSLSEGSGAEKLRRTARARREEAKRFDAFVAEVSAPTPRAEEPILPQEPLAATQANGAGLPTVEKISEEGEMGEDFAAIDDGAEASTIRKEGEPFAGERTGGNPSEELFQRAIESDEVRLRIIGEYLNSLGKTGAPLTARGTGVLATPPARAKTVLEAGAMALHYLRKPNG